MRRSPLALTLLALVAIFAFAALPARAEEPAGHGAAAEGSGHEQGPLDVNLVIAGATVVVFVLLLVVLTKTAWKPILSGLKAREDGIRSQIEGAEKANADAKALLAEYQTKLATATDEARAIVEEGRKDGVALKASIEADAKAEAARERDRAIKDIEVARLGALKDIYEQVSVVATDVASRILKQRLDPAQHRRLVDDAVGEYERSRKSPGART
jgi:F-type H+-transporting ATPase subunit b